MCGGPLRHGACVASPAPSLRWGGLGRGSIYQGGAQGQPGIEPGRPWQRLRGYWLAPVNITGCYAQVWSVVRGAHLVSTPLRLAPSRPSGWHNPRYVLRPFAPARGTSWRSCRAEDQSKCWPWLRHRRKRPQPGAARGPDGWPRPTTRRPQGAPQRDATWALNESPHGLDAGQAARVVSPRNRQRMLLAHVKAKPFGRCARP